MSRFPSLPLYTDAFLADTMHLNAHETGAYLMLLMVAWRSPDCRLPDDDKKLAKWARCDPRTWAKTKPSVMEFWDLAEGYWTQKRLVLERDKVSKRAEAARENGAQGGRPKSLNNQDPPNPTGSGRVTQKKPPISISNSTEVGEANASLPQRAAREGPTQAELEAEFSAKFWPAVWKREDRLDALKAFVAARRKGATLEAIMVGVAAYSAHVRGRERRYQKLPAVWLRAGGWESEYLPESPRPANRNGGRNGGSTLDALDRFIELDRQQTEREMQQGLGACGDQAAPRLLSAG